MKKFSALLVLVLASCSLFAQDISGTWNGDFSVQGQTLRINIHLTETDDGYTSTLDSPDQNAFGIAVDTTSYKEPDVKIVINALNFVYTGKASQDNKIEGSFTQMGQTFDLDFTKKEE
jgi:hypothetical protein